MASDNETLDEEKKQEDVAVVEEDKAEEAEKIEVENDHKEEQEVENTEEEDSKMADKEEEALKDQEDKRLEGNVEEEDSKEEVETSKKSRRSRKKTPIKSESNKSVVEVESSSKEAPATPIERPTRERKVVERYTENYHVRASATKPLSIEKGAGTQLKDIPNVAFKLSKRKPDDNLQLLHVILYGKRTKVHTLKKHIGMFSGYVWLENEEKQRAKVKERIDRYVKEKLVDFCDILNIPVVKSYAKKEDLSAKLLEFLESPHATTETLLADKEPKGKKRKGKATSSKSPSSMEPDSEAPAKKKKQNSESGAKRKRSSKSVEEDEVDDKVEPSESKDDSQEEEDDNDAVLKEESDEESKSEGEDEDEEIEPEKLAPREMSSYKKVIKKDSRVKNVGKTKSVRKPRTAKSAKTTPKSTKKSSAKEESDQESKLEGEEEDEEVEPKKWVPSERSSSKEIIEKDSGGKIGVKSKSVKKTSPAKPSKATPKSSKKSSTTAMKKKVDDASHASGASGSTSKSKISSTKKQKVEKEPEKDQSVSAKEKTPIKKQRSKSSTKILAKDQGKEKAGEKAKPEPTKEEMHAVVVDMLKKVDFNTATLSDILNQLGDHFEVDLVHRKAEVKTIITEVISNMTDDDEEAEAGEDDNDT